MQDRAINKSYVVCRMAPFHDLEQHLTQISRSRHYLTLNISETARNTYKHSYNEILRGTFHTPYSRMSFRIQLLAK